MRLLGLRSLSARIVALTLVALVLGQLVSFSLFMVERSRFIDTLLTNEVTSWLGSMVRVLEQVPADGREPVLEAASSGLHWFRLEPEPLIPMQDGAPLAADLTVALQRSLGGEIAGLHSHIGRLPQAGLPASEQPMLITALQLPDGQWLHYGRVLLDPTAYWARTSILTVLISGLLMAVVVVIAGHRLARPLDRLSVAAEKLGRGEPVELLVEEGPEDVRRTTRAFNAMRRRLERFVQDRTRMIAAIAHDLRTPITALRLRLEFLPDDDNRRRMEENIRDMADMAEASLAFAREDATVEPSRSVDVAALLDVIAEDCRTQGQQVDFETDRRVPLQCRPAALKRALRNLVDNAVTYGREARIRLDEDVDNVHVVIDDIGPGIPESELENVFGPFVRLETSRSSSTGGSGLGLSIARTIVHSHGGEVWLRNRGDGLSARVTLPRRPATA